VKRCLLNLVTAVSLALCVVVLALWVRSRYVEDQVMWRRVDGARWVVTSPGYVVFGVELANWSGWPADAFGLSYTRADPLPPAEHVVRMLVLNVGPRDTFEKWTGGGFGWYRWRPASGGSTFVRLVIPLWSLAGATVALPAGRAAARLWRRSRRRPGGCAACGYDLTGNVSGVCPECGTPKL
jgi:hypothetical protein